MADVALQLVSYSRWVVERVLQSGKKKDDERKKKLLLGFCVKTRGRVAALLVAVRWAKDKENIVARASEVTQALAGLKVRDHRKEENDVKDWQLVWLV